MYSNSNTIPNSSEQETGSGSLLGVTVSKSQFTNMYVHSAVCARLRN
jgi:hypothetical protein